MQLIAPLDEPAFKESERYLRYARAAGKITVDDNLFIAAKSMVHKC